MYISITLIIILGTSVVSIMAWQKPNLLSALWLWPPAIRHGQWYRLLSYGLVHADGMHLAFNMFTLYFFGSMMERFYIARLGVLGYLLFYAGGLLVSVLPSYLQHRNDSNYRSLGASGAVSAVLFAFILLRPWATILVFFIPLPAIVFAALYVGYSVMMDRRGRDNINHSAHLWGAAYGIIVTLLVEPGLLGYFLEQLSHPRIGF